MCVDATLSSAQSRRRGVAPAWAGLSLVVGHAVHIAAAPQWVPCPSSHTSRRGLAAQVVMCTCAWVCGCRPRVRVAVRGSSCSFSACAGGLACLSRSRPSWFPLWEYIPRCFRYRRVSLCHTCTKTLASSLKNHRYPRTGYPQGSPSAQTPPNGPSHRHITTLCNCFVTACSTATTRDFTPVHIWSNVLGHTQGSG